MWTYNYSDELYHHGIKGQKWGVRRFQNKNGTLTSAGKKRYSESEGPLTYPKNASKTTKKVIDDYNSLSDQEFFYKYSTAKKNFKKRLEKYRESPLTNLYKKQKLDVDKETQEYIDSIDAQFFAQTGAKLSKKQKLWFAKQYEEEKKRRNKIFDDIKKYDKSYRREMVDELLNKKILSE